MSLETWIRQHAPGRRSLLALGPVRAALDTYKIFYRGAKGYQRLYEVRCAELTSVRDERDRILRSLERQRAGKAALPPGLQGRQLCFLHIGKTAGTSVQHALFEAMSGTAIFHESLEKFDTATAAELAINDLVIGHFGYQHVAKCRSDRFLMTFLRDPVERVLSNYHFLRSGSPLSNYSAHAIDAAKAMNLPEFLRCEDPGVRMVTENFQAKALAFDIRPQHRADIADLRGQAERNLATFDFVGIVDYFDESMAVLSDMLGREVAPKQLNKTSTREAAPPVSAEDLELIRKLNAIDIAIYDAAKLRFEQIFLPPSRNAAPDDRSSGH